VRSCARFLAPTHLEELVRVLGIEMRPELAQRRQVQLTASDQREHLWKATTHPSPGHAAPRGPLAHPERFNAVCKCRAEAELQMKLALLELRQVREHIPGPDAPCVPATLHPMSNSAGGVRHETRARR
jgi:hypothetical protein